MLKIKDNVDLKELEKFGFEYNEYTKCYDNQKKDMYISDRTICNISVMEMLDLEEYENLLYDLIKADLVEKVGD